jgi:formamidopyrimidine-DNA glycosylase
MDRFRQRAVGKAIVAVRRAGKRVVIWLAKKGSHRSSVDSSSSGVPGEEAIVLEPRMTGLVLLADPPSQDHLRLRIALKGGVNRELLFWDRRGLGSVRLLSADEFSARFGATGTTLGPDALELSAEGLRQRFAGSRRAIKVALLDQRAVAGIGNLYASEILYLAAIHPAALCQTLRPEHWTRIHTAMLDVLEAAIRHEGSTLSDGTYRNALNQSGGYQNMHRVYDRADEPCGRCRSPIVRIVQAQRSTFFCPQCQPRRRG